MLSEDIEEYLKTTFNGAMNPSVCKKAVYQVQCTELEEKNHISNFYF